MPPTVEVDGDKYDFTLRYNGAEWSASYERYDTPVYFSMGETPKQAVENLYINLNN